MEYASLHCQDAYTETLTADGFHQGGLGSGPVVNCLLYTSNRFDASAGVLAHLTIDDEIIKHWNMAAGSFTLSSPKGYYVFAKCCLLYTSRCV